MAELSHRRKLARAYLHTKNVEALLTLWSSDGYRTFPKSNGQGRAVLYAEQVKPLPDDLPLIIGDALQCLRNSLDHIVFALSKGMTPEQEHIPEFPIGDTAVEPGDRRIQFLSQAAQDDVCALAPNPTRQPLDQDPLWLLNKMSNRDKHREIAVSPIVSAASGSYVLLASDGTDYFRSFTAERLEVGADPVPLCEFAESPGVKAQISPSIQILFDQGVEVENREVVPTLRWFHDHIRDTVFQRLEQHL